MPRNNRADAKRKVTNPKVGQEPAVQTTPSAPEIIIRQNLQDALIEGLQDPSKWMMYFLDIKPYEAQCELLRATRDCTEDNFVAGNRAGKTWTSGGRLLWKAFYRHISPFTAPEYITPDNVYKSVSTSLTIDQAKLAWTYAHTFATRSKRFRPFYKDAIYSPHPTMFLQTKNEKGEWVPAEIWARSLARDGVHLLGHSINYILVDECAYIKNYPKIEDEVIRMRLADTGGSISRASTPNGKNFFYDYFLQGLPARDGYIDPRYHSKRITSWDNPAISKEYLREQKERMIPDFYQQNVMGEFVSLSDFFKSDQVQALYSDLDEEYRLNVPPKSGGAYAMGVDLGAARDATIIYVFDVSKTPVEMVYQQEVRNQSWRASREAVAGAYGLYKPARTFIDATGVGAPIAQQLIEEDGLENVTPFIFTASSKPALLVQVQDAVQRRNFVFPYSVATRTLIHQMSFYRLDDKDIQQDAVMALALAWGAVEELRKRPGFFTNIPDDMAVVQVRAGARLDPDFELGMPSPDELQRGEILDFDPNSGLFVPRSYTGGWDRWGTGL